MTFGYDTMPNGACSIKNWENTPAVACMILFSYGGIRDRNFVEPNLDIRLTKMVQNEVEKKFDSLAWNTATDLRYVALMIGEALKGCNSRIREANKLLGSKSYVGGVVCYTDGCNMLAIPFGGGCAYVCSESVIKPINKKMGTDLIDDALGCTEEWKSKCFQGTVQQNDRLILTSGEIAPSVLLPLLKENQAVAEGGYQNTLAMQIRAALKKRSLATMEICF